MTMDVCRALHVDVIPGRTTDARLHVDTQRPRLAGGEFLPSVCGCCLRELRGYELWLFELLTNDVVGLLRLELTPLVRYQIMHYLIHEGEIDDLAIATPTVVGVERIRN